jgi:undecaprenyl-diphosphatase
MTPQNDAGLRAEPVHERPARSRLLELPELRHWIAVPFGMSIIVFALGLAAMTPAYQASELAIDQRLSTEHVAWLNAVSLAIEQVFGPRGAVAILVLLLVGLWVVRRTPVDAIAVVGVTAFGWVFSLIFKYAIHRHRPDPGLLADPLSPDMDPNSFPSGHVCFAVSLTIALYFLLRHRRWSPWILVAGFAVAAFAAWTRVYVGVHYPMDVLASFPASIAGILLFSGIWNRLAPPVLGKLPFIARLESR